MNQNPVPDGGLVPDSGLAQRHDSIGGVDGPLVEASLQGELGLTQLKLIDSVVCLRLVIAERRLKERANSLGGEIAAEDLAERIADAADEVRVGRGRPANRAQAPGCSRQAGLAFGGEHLQRRQDAVLGSGGRDLRGRYTRLFRRQIRPVREGLPDQVLQRRQVIFAGDYYRIDRYDVDNRELGIGYALAAQ